MSAETPFLTHLFRQLHEAGVVYCVLRDHETLPENTDGHDLDLLVKPGDLDRAFDILRATAHQHGGHLVSFYRAEALITRFCGKDARWWGVAVDLFPALSFRALPYYDAEMVLNSRIQHRGIPVAAPEHAVMSGFLKGCLFDGKDRKGYHTPAVAAFLKQSELFSTLFQRVFGPRMTTTLVNQFTQNPPAGKKTFRSLGRCLRRALWRRGLRQEPLPLLQRTFHLRRQQLSRIFNPPGFTVVFLGADGAGKTTLINAIHAPLDRAMHGAVEVCHSRPHLLPSLSRLLRPWHPEVSEQNVNPHGGKPSGFGGSLLRVGWYTLDYILGYWIKIFPVLVRRPMVSIFDRYFYDYYFDPARSLIALPEGLIRFLDRFFVPRPNIILCLGADPEKLHQRKPELTLAEVRNQVKRLQEFCDQNSSAVWIDTGTTIADSVDQVLGAITVAMAVRYPNTVS